MKLIHAKYFLETSSFKFPFEQSDIKHSLPVPPYSTIVGMISCCLGRPLKIDETRIGYSYEFRGKGCDLEPLQKLELTNSKVINAKKKGIHWIEFNTCATFDLYLDNINLYDELEDPYGFPTLGRSSNLLERISYDIIDVEKTNSGYIKPTLLPFPCVDFGGILCSHTDYFKLGKDGTREPAVPPITYQIVPNSKEGIYINRDNLYKLPNENRVIYMHTLGSVE